MRGIARGTSAEHRVTFGSRFDDSVVDRRLDVAGGSRRGQATNAAAQGAFAAGPAEEVTTAR